MKKYIVLLPVFFCLLQACSSTKKTSGPGADAATAAGTTAAAPGAQADGSSFEKAIVIQSKSETDGVKAEYVWLAKNYPGYKLEKQQLSFNDKKAYDVMSIVTKEGESRKVYFDINGFFGKF